MKIRKANNRDIPALISIVKGVSSIEDYPGEYNATLFRKMIKDKETILLVAEINNEIAGFKEFKIDKGAKRVWGESIAVSKKFQGKGIGLALLGAMEDYAINKRMKRISFLVRDWNNSMNKLAKKKGYKISDKFYFWEKKI